MWRIALSLEDLGEAVHHHMKTERNNEFVKEVANQKYEFGFTTNVETDVIPKGLNEDIVRLISKKKGEPDWLLEFRLKAYRF